MMTRRREFIHGAPSNPSDAWTLAAGGRIYDNWWDALDREEPEGTHPSYPASAEQEGAVTWRCKECHGWDYKGVDGVYRSGSHYTGIKGIDGAIGMDESATWIFPLPWCVRQGSGTLTPLASPKGDLRFVTGWIRFRHVWDRLRVTIINYPIVNRVLR
jgi:hypothetical protein